MTSGRVTVTTPADALPSAVVRRVSAAHAPHSVTPPGTRTGSAYSPFATATTPPGLARSSAAWMLERGASIVPLPPASAPARTHTTSAPSGRPSGHSPIGQGAPTVRHRASPGKSAEAGPQSGGAPSGQAAQAGGAPVDPCSSAQPSGHGSNTGGAGLAGAAGGAGAVGSATVGPSEPASSMPASIEPGGSAPSQPATAMRASSRAWSRISALEIVPRRAVTLLPF
jgi:hypothetical protein